MAEGESAARGARAVVEPGADGRASALLHEACMNAARHFQRADPSADGAPQAAVVALERAVRAYVEICKRDQLPPEQTLVCVKEVIRACAPMIGHARAELAMREVVFSGFLAAYFPAGRRRASAGGALRAPAQSVTVNEAH